MGETCEVCRLPIDFAEWMCGNQSVCAGANLANCYRLGYEREKARADAAEEWRHAGNALVKQLRADLAAARRECDLLREELAKRGNISAPHSQMLPETP